MGCDVKLIGFTFEMSLNVLILTSAATGRRNLHMIHDLLEEIFVKCLGTDKEAICRRLQ